MLILSLFELFFSNTLSNPNDLESVGFDMFNSLFLDKLALNLALVIEV